MPVSSQFPVLDTCRICIASATSSQVRSVLRVAALKENDLHISCLSNVRI